MDEGKIVAAYNEAKDRYAALNVDADAALDQLKSISLSLQCWQGDDVGGFEKGASDLSCGLAVTGNYPGKARSLDELRSDLKMALSLIPGSHRVNLHAMYGDFKEAPADRDAIEPEHFASWIDWAKEIGIGLDFNATCFSHPLADEGYTLSNEDETVRGFWIEHCKRCRKIGAWMGEVLGSPTVHNLWIPDGSKDITVSRFDHRAILKESLDAIHAEEFSKDFLKDSAESKLFGIGSESYVVGSFDFYLPWAVGHRTMLCLDMGHYHPTESVADKISALLLYLDELLLHVSRGVRWDSDHVVILNDDLRAMAEEVVRANALDKVNFALDFFDASINRIGAWVIGARATQQALLQALLEPVAQLKELENQKDFFGRLALLEQCKSLPFGAVWDYFCHITETPGPDQWVGKVKEYESEVLSKR